MSIFPVSDIDKWAADQCGITLYTTKQSNEHGYYWFDNVCDYDYEWTIQDPRCREIFRAWWIKEHTGTVTFCLDGKVRYDSTAALTHIVRDNELACIKAIWEGSDNE